MAYQSYPSSGQIEEIVSRVRRHLRSLNFVDPEEKYADVVRREADVIGKLVAEELARRLQRRATTDVRRVKVDRTRSPRELLEASGRKLLIDNRDLVVFDSMPRQPERPSEVDVYFFMLGRYVDAVEWEQELADLGLVPDYYAQFQANIDDPGYAGPRRNGMHWRDGFGRACCVGFHNGNFVPTVLCDDRGRGWSREWWCAGALPTMLLQDRD